MQACGRRALWMPGDHDSDRLATLHHAAGFDGRGNRFVGRAQPVDMLDRHDGLAADISRKDDSTCASGSNGDVGDGAEVDATVAGQPVLSWVVEPSNNLMWCGKRPLPTGFGAGWGGTGNRHEDGAEQSEKDRHRLIAPRAPP